MDEAHVEHAVGFVEHQHLHGGQVQEALLLQVEQAAGGGHQDVDAAFHGVDLRVHADTTEDDGGGQREVFAIDAHRLFDLGREFAGGREHQGADADAAETAFGAFGAGEALQHGQGESGGLAGARLGATEQVATGQHGGDRFHLNGGGGFVTVLAHGLHDGRGQVQIVKGHVD